MSASEQESRRPSQDDDFFRQLYDDKAEYVARRDPASLEARLIRLEVEQFKLPNLLSVLPRETTIETVLEIGCATGELLAAFPAPAGARKIGFDISRENVQCAAARHPGIDFRCEDFRTFEGTADVVILSDVLEHVPDDTDMLRAAGAIADIVLVNLPLEDNWLNDRRRYGPDDLSGHLRRYTLAQGLALFEAAGLETVRWRRVWVHETECDRRRHVLRREVTGSRFSGGRMANAAKQGIYTTARIVRPLGRRLFPSNLFASARLRKSP